MHSFLTRCYCLALIAISPIASAEDFEFKIPITQQNSGSYHINGSLEDAAEVEFLIDTGAGMVILAESTFKSLSQVSNRKPLKRIAVRLADGRTKPVNVYSIERLVLGEECNVGPLEVAVIPGAKKNILGMDILTKAAPFAIFTSPPSLALSACSRLASSFAATQENTLESLLLTAANTSSSNH